MNLFVKTLPDPMINYGKTNPNGTKKSFLSDPNLKSVVVHMRVAPKVYAKIQSEASREGLKPARMIQAILSQWSRDIDGKNASFFA